MTKNDVADSILGHDLYCAIVNCIVWGFTRKEIESLMQEKFKKALRVVRKEVGILVK
jgi:hypothetical protein